MKILKIILNLSLLIFLYNCADYKVKKTKIDKQLYSSKGFALIYSKDLHENGILKRKIEGFSSE